MEVDDWAYLSIVQDRSYQHARKVLLSSYPKECSMSAAELHDFLGKKRYAILATSRPDGRAHATPVGFLVWRKALWIASVEGTKVRNLRSRPWASIVIIEGEPPGRHRAVITEGKAKLYVTPSLALAPADLVGSWEQKHGHRPDWANVLVEVIPERLFSYDGGKGKSA